MGGEGWHFERMSPFWSDRPVKTRGEHGERDGDGRRTRGSMDCDRVFPGPTALQSIGPDSPYCGECKKGTRCYAPHFGDGEGSLLFPPEMEVEGAFMCVCV